MASIADVNLKLMSASALLDADPAAAVRAAGEILSHHPDNAAASLLLATAARKLGNTALAIEVLGALSHSQPAAAFIRLELARAYCEAGRGAESVAELREALSIEPALAEGWRELSSQLAAAGDAHGADVAYERYAALASQPWQLAEPSAALADNRGAAAEAMLRRILRDAPRDVAAMRMLADALARREAYAEAGRLLHQALDLTPGYSAARYDLACLLLMQQKAADILPLVERLLRLDPKNAVYRDLSASVFSMTGQHAQAIETWGALVAAPNAGYAEWLNYGHELKTAGRTQ
jgi:predicted Zn-dependent protease